MPNVPTVKQRIRWTLIDVPFYFIIAVFLSIFFSDYDWKWWIVSFSLWETLIWIFRSKDCDNWLDWRLFRLGRKSNGYE